MNGNSEDSSIPSQRPIASFPRANSTTNVHNGPSTGGGFPRAQPEQTRRGYSDGDTLSSRQNTSGSSASGARSGRDRRWPPGHTRNINAAERPQSVGDELETWQYFLSHAPTDERSRRRLSAMQRAMIQSRNPSEVGLQGDPPLAYLRERYQAQQRSPPVGRRPHGSSSSSGGTQSSGSSYASVEARAPLPQTPQNHQSDQFGDEEYVLPRWQPDSEVTECPICRRQFAFWFRKHHCRKCGRVVCANCSPHRITIPRQFIVHPPTEASSTSQMTSENVVDLTGDDGDGNARGPVQSPGRPHRSSLGGGQEVRLCNPCVPDPNPLPPPPPYAPASTPQRTTFPRYSQPGLYPWSPSMPGSSSNTSNTTEAARRRAEPLRDARYAHGSRNSYSEYNTRPPQVSGNPLSKYFHSDLQQHLYSRPANGNHLPEYNVPSISPFGSAPNSSNVSLLPSALPPISY